MDDIYEYLKLDHRNVEKIFKLYSNATTDRNKLEIVAMLNKELTVHAVSEEDTFYKILEHHKESKKEALHGEHEHQKIKDKLSELMNITQVNKQLDEKVQQLKELVEHHVSDEEGKIFGEAKDVISKEEAHNLKLQMHDLKGKIILKEFPE